MAGLFDPAIFDPAIFDYALPVEPAPYVFHEATSSGAGERVASAIEAWVTSSAGVYITHLDRSQASPFRHFAMTTGIDGVGLGSLEYHLDNALVIGQDDLFAYGNLVWFKYRGKTRVWIVEDRRTALDENEHATDWVTVSGRGVRQLIGDRLIQPTNYSDTNHDPSQWGLGDWATKTTASAALGQAVISVASTVAGAGAQVGAPLEIVGGGNRQVGIIASIVAGVSVTLQDNLAYTFPAGSRVRAAALQWRRFVNRRAGEMLWDLISESNPRFATQLVRGTVETTLADGWTQDFRFDNMLDVLNKVTDRYGDVDIDGLTFNYYNALGTDRTTSVILEEGMDVLRLDVQDSDRDSLSWVVAEGTGHAVFSYLAPKKILTRAQRKTAARKAALTHRKAPAAPRKVIEVKADYAIDFASEAVNVARRREAFIDAKDISDIAQLDALTDAVLDEHQITEAVGIELDEVRFAVDTDYGLGDWVRVIVPSRGFDEDVRIVAISYTEDDSGRIRVALEVNDARAEHLMRLARGAANTAYSLGVQNRQPQGQLTNSTFTDTVYFDSTTGSVTGIYILDDVYVTTKCRVAIDFDQYPMPVSAAASSGTLTSTSGGGATSGASSASSSAGGGGHVHQYAGRVSSTPGGFALAAYSSYDGVDNPIQVDFQSNATALYTLSTTTHTHTIAHTHTTPNHTHDVAGHTHSLTAAATKEAYPASHNVTLTVYELVNTTWTLRGTVSGLTNDVEDLDLKPYIVGPGRWRIVLQSAAAQPNAGRLGAHISGALVGAIQSA